MKKIEIIIKIIDPNDVECNTNVEKSSWKTIRYRAALGQRGTINENSFISNQTIVTNEN